MCKKTALTLAMVSIPFFLVLAMGNAWMVGIVDKETKREKKGK